MKTNSPSIRPEEILSGWKEIARYLGKGVRTVQRYALEKGLPVRRVSGHKKSAVTARKSDLASWITSSATAQESFNKDTRGVLAYLRAEMAKGPHQRALQDEVTAALRKETKKDLQKVQADISKVHQELKAMRKRQESIAWTLQQQPKRSAVTTKARKPN